LEENRIHIIKTILFGSYAKGNFNEWSDIDLSLVSNNFHVIRFNDIEAIRKYKFGIYYSISPMPYREEDFTSDGLFVKAIIETGIKIT
jgi:uncharacterized protein